MEFKHTLEIVTKDIQDIEKLVGNFKNYPKIPNIELDLALSRLRNVYDILLMFRDESQQSSQHAVTEKKAEIKKLPETESQAKNIAEQADATIPAIPSQKQEIPVLEPEPKVITDKPIVNKAEPEKQYINEKLGGQTSKKDVSAKMQGQPIKSIAGSLGINDKFFFIRELFGGNAETFRQTMADLDESANFNEAYSLLINKFQWDMESEPVQTLLNLIRRKFIPSGNE